MSGVTPQNVIDQVKRILVHTKTVKTVLETSPSTRDVALFTDECKTTSKLLLVVCCENSFFYIIVMFCVVLEIKQFHSLVSTFNGSAKKPVPSSMLDKGDSIVYFWSDKMFFFLKKNYFFCFCVSCDCVQRFVIVW
jgi:hypothetical protein